MGDEVVNQELVLRQNLQQDVVLGDYGGLQLHEGQQETFHCR